MKLEIYSEFQFTVRDLLKTSTISVRDIRCLGQCRNRSAKEHATRTQLVFPYRGVYVRHVGRDDAVAESNQVLFFNAAQDYQVSHPVPGGDACLNLIIDQEQLRELAPPALLCDAATPAFRMQRLRIDPLAQMLVAQLRHRLSRNLAEPLEAETTALSLARQVLGPRTAHLAGSSAGASGTTGTTSSSRRRRLADRVKLLLASDPSRRWTLAEIAAEVGGSPVYLTQVFQEIEGLPLYRYQLRLRLARALDHLPNSDDLTALGLDLGFSSHSHFSAAFRETYGRTPSEFRRTARHR